MADLDGLFDDEGEVVAEVDPTALVVTSTMNPYCHREFLVVVAWRSYDVQVQTILFGISTSIYYSPYCIYLARIVTQLWWL